MSLSDNARALLAGLCISGLVPYLAVWALWSLLGDLLLDFAWWALLAGAVAACAWLLRSLVRDGWGR